MADKEETFRDRVKRVFGSLASSPNPSLWSITDNLNNDVVDDVNVQDSTRMSDTTLDPQETDEYDGKVNSGRENGGHRLKDYDAEARRSHLKTSSVNDGEQLKPILKKRERNTEESRPRKRVRFEPSCGHNDSKEVSEAFRSSTACSGIDVTDTAGGEAAPSKYTCYGLESSSEYNMRASMDTLQLAERPKPTESEEDALVGLSKNECNNTRVDDHSNYTKQKQEENGKLTLNKIAAEETKQHEISDMEEDQTGTVSTDVSSGLHNSETGEYI